MMFLYFLISSLFIFFFNAPSTTEIYTLSLHDAFRSKDISNVVTDAASGVVDIFHGIDKAVAEKYQPRSEERFSRNAETDLVCRLLLEKKKERIIKMSKQQENQFKVMSSYVHEVS